MDCRGEGLAKNYCTFFKINEGESEGFPEKYQKSLCDAL
jgi:hypothetical protein